MSAHDLFNHREVTLEYRPVRESDEEVTWFWVLLPKSNSRALSCGSASNKGRASIQARKEARRLNVRITQITTQTDQTAEICS